MRDQFGSLEWRRLHGLFMNCNLYSFDIIPCKSLYLGEIRVCLIGENAWVYFQLENQVRLIHVIGTCKLSFQSHNLLLLRIIIDKGLGDSYREAKDINFTRFWLSWRIELLDLQNRLHCSLLSNYFLFHECVFVKSCVFAQLHLFLFMTITVQTLTRMKCLPCVLDIFYTHLLSYYGYSFATFHPLLLYLLQRNTKYYSLYSSYQAEVLAHISVFQPNNNWLKSSVDFFCTR